LIFSSASLSRLAIYAAAAAIACAFASVLGSPPSFVDHLQAAAHLARTRVVA
jgi:hypothetical protein